MVFRDRGISVLIACQNEEVTVGWSILSFLRFADEIIVVDNGSTDATKDICREMERRYPEQVKFYDVPHLRDLSENRQYALEHSRYEWVVRADADYVCYDDGEFDCVTLRQQLLDSSRLTRPSIYHLFHPNLRGDFWHTLCEAPTNSSAEPGAGSVWCHPMPRIYKVWPGFRFCRMGRWEGGQYPRMVRKLVHNIVCERPIWMHCDVKSDMNMLLRSERTNWRQMGEFHRYPTVERFLLERIRDRFGTDDVATAAAAHVNENVLPELQSYDPGRYYPYPTLVLQAMQEFPVYRVRQESGGKIRRRDEQAIANYWCQTADKADKSLIAS